MNPTSSRPRPEAFNNQELLQRCLGRVDFAARVLDKFRHQLELDVEELEQAVESRNMAAAALAAHRIKGASANVAAHGLRECAAEIEQVASGNGTDVAPSLVELQNECRRFVECVAKFPVSCHE